MLEDFLIKNNSFDSFVHSKQFVSNVIYLQVISCICTLIGHSWSISSFDSNSNSSSSSKPRVSNIYIKIKAFYFILNIQENTLTIIFVFQQLVLHQLWILLSHLVRNQRNLRETNSCITCICVTVSILFLSMELFLNIYVNVIFLNRIAISWGENVWWIMKNLVESVVYLVGM